MSSKYKQIVILLVGSAMIIGVDTTEATSHDVSWTFGNNFSSSYKLDAFEPNDAGLGATIGAEDPTLTLQAGKRYQVTITNFGPHPFQVIAKGASAGSDTILLAMGATDTDYENNPGVGWTDDGAGTVTFTMTIGLYNAMISPGHVPGYRCGIHSTAMRGDFNVEGVPVFTDVTSTAGISLPATLNESLAWGDYDNDGDLDLYLTNDGPNKLFRNDGNDTFTDVTAIAGVGNTGFSVGTAFGDLDNDGDLDLYVVNFGTGPDVLYRNDGDVGIGGEYVFTDVTASAGTTAENSTRGVAFLDYDRDGLLDIFVNSFTPVIFYHNLGNLTFENVGLSLGLVSANVGVVCSDVDNNGWIDIFTGNRDGALNRLYLNNGGVFTDVTVAAGIDKVGLGMGVHAFDYDNDLDMDLYWTSWPGANSGNALYENIDGMSFTDVAVSTGTLDPNGWGISDNAGDIDNDGWEDFFVTNGFSIDTTANVLFYNNGDKTFTDINSVLGNLDFDGRGVAFADYDNDGDLDLCVTSGPSSETRLWRNDSNNTNNWLTLQLAGTCSNRSAIGARVEVTTDLTTTVKEVSGGAGRGSQNSLPLEFGLGSATTIEQIRIRWSSGFVQTIPGITMNTYQVITESPVGDLDGDCDVDFLDVSLLTGNWLVGVK
ncbi:MAG: CRTAC1 family protein [Planctomycetota bacterium]|jgi:hypothetical protein